jgi:MFS family permease
MATSKMIFLLIVASTFFTFMSLGIYALTFAPFATSQLGLAPSLVGAIIGVSGLIRIFLDLPLGVVLDRVGRRVPGLIGTLFFAGSAVIATVASHALHLVLFQLCQGLGQMFFMAANTVLIADLAPSGKLGRYVSLWQIGINLGDAVGPILAGLLLVSDGYQVVFGLSAGITLIPVALYGVIVWQQHGRSSLRGRARPRVRIPIRVVLQNTRILGGCFAAFASFFVLSGIRSTVWPLYSTEVLHLNAAVVGQVLGVTSLVNSVLLLPSGLLTDRVSRRNMLMGGFALFILSLGSFLVWTTSSLLVLTAGILGAASAAVGPARIVAVTESAPPNGRGTAMGLYRTFQSLAFLSGPLVSGVVYEAAPLTPFLVGIGVCGAAIGVIFAVLRPRGT